MDASELQFQHPISCYNGCYDSKTQAVINRQEAVLKEIRKKEPNAHVTYFPQEEEFVVHDFGRELSKYHKTKGGALAEAYNKLYPEKGEQQ